ncbi:MAG TPA: ABC-F family ATP-binding cassette domain-containing protein [Synergistales bacterium]|nr:ABC-F family ATP-binding cassette domain-containing protein [Synergistales bacterium]HRV71060.1 ABC-F family ATP-binding cassette domain-containing protein [Thermovirgaceae bacterium]
MIRCSGIFLVLGGKQVFEGLSLSVPKGTRLGIVGDNGAGKTTLFRLINGEVSPDRGDVSIPSSSRLGYLPQDLVEIGSDRLMDFLKDRAGISSLEREIARIGEDLSVPGLEEQKRRGLIERHERAVRRFESAEGYGFEARASKILKGLGFRDGDGARNCTEFSGGWKMRASLASILLCRPDILLLDEPTNHLDTESMEWLESYLLSFPGTLLAISHDRRFLDRLTTSTAELSGGKTRLYSGNFSSYVEKREKELEIEEKSRKRQAKETARTMEFIERFRYKATKATQVQSRIRKLDKTVTLEAQSAARRVSMRFPECPRSGLEVIRAEDVAHSYEGKTVFSGVDLTIRRGERTALVGINGAGKSTLTRLLAGKENPSEGTVRMGHRVISAFFSQESADNLDYGHSVWDEIRKAPSVFDEPQRRNLLGSFLFSGNDIEKPVGVLSGGEKSRLALLKILLSKTNLLILDEPTNHLDMATRDLFQEALLGYGGTIVIVSHDRDFLDNLVDRVIEIRDGKIFDYPGNYSWFIEKREAARIAAGRDETSKTGDLPQDGGQKEKKRLEAETRNRIYRERKKFLDKLSPIEEGIERAEKEIASIDTSLADPLVLSNSEKVKRLMVERSRLEKESGAMMQKWEEIMSSMEAACPEE